jgi:hypothetical protein
MSRISSAVAVLAAALAVAAKADVTISTHATSHMSCVGNVCTPTAAKAVLNISQLQSMLSSANATVTSSSAAPDIHLAAGLSWSSTSVLTLDAYRSVDVERPILLTADGGLSIVTDDGGSGGVFTFGKLGSVHYLSLSGTLTVNGTAYTLVDSVPALASGIVSNASGNFALAHDVDAGPDGTYAFAPVVTAFSGKLEGLGNTISNLSIRHGNRKLGLFADIAAGGRVENIVLTKMRLHATGGVRSFGGALAAANDGTIFNAHVSGKISTQGVGGTGGALVGVNNGTIDASSANDTPQVGSACVGGLVGSNAGTLSRSYAQGSAAGVQAGGLACKNSGTIVNSYDLAQVLGRQTSPFPGGLTSVNESGGSIATSYAAGQITAVSSFGGVAGTNNGGLSQVYWDIEDTGASAANGCGAGSCSGATGLVRAQLQAALPAGFDPSVWAQAPGVNNGLPYLIGNPPR